MDYFISGDIGGTKTLLQAVAAQDDQLQVYCERRYASREYGTFSELLKDFFEEIVKSDPSLKARAPAAACFAVAGPIEQGKVHLTNLPWVMDSAAIAFEFSIPEVKLINDFAAVALSIEILSASDLVVLQTGHVYPEEMRVVLGAGTGMGVAWLIWKGGSYTFAPSEAGHMDFAPADELQDRLLQYLRDKLGHVSVERILSGPGLTNVFNFLQADQEAHQTANRGEGLRLTPRQMQAILGEDGAAQVTELAFNQGHPIALQALDLFIQIYGAYAGNLALAGLSRGGVYIAGGMAPRIIDKLMEGGFSKVFMTAFRSKGRFRALMEKIPVHAVINPKAGLMGAAREARRMCSYS